MQAAAAVATEAAAAAKAAADAAGGDADECAARLAQWNEESGEATPAEAPARLVGWKLDGIEYFDYGLSEEGHWKDATTARRDRVERAGFSPLSAASDDGEEGGDDIDEAVETAARSLL
jgi:hypothetical protein